MKVSESTHSTLEKHTLGLRQLRPYRFISRYLYMYLKASFSLTLFNLIEWIESQWLSHIRHTSQQLRAFSSVSLFPLKLAAGVTQKLQSFVKLSRGTGLIETDITSVTATWTQNTLCFLHWAGFGAERWQP